MDKAWEKMKKTKIVELLEEHKQALCLAESTNRQLKQLFNDTKDQYSIVHNEAFEIRGELIKSLETIEIMLDLLLAGQTVDEDRENHTPLGRQLGNVIGRIKETKFTVFKLPDIKLQRG